MHVRTVNRGLGLLATGIAALVATSLPAGAAVDHALATKGSNPNAPFCQFGKKEAKSTASVEAKEESALESGNWASAQKIIISTFGSLNAIVKNDGAALKGVPSNVRSAITTTLKEIPAEEKAVRSSSSVSQFESSVTKFFDSKKMESAVKVVDAYQTATCGSTTPST